MKKFVCMLLIALLVLSLTACDPADFYYNYDDLKGNVETIELINYNNPEAKRFSSKRDILLPFDFEKMEIIEELPVEKVDEFLIALSEVHFFMNYRHSDSPKGNCIRIIYKTGDFEIIGTDFYECGGYVGSFESKGNVKRFIGSPVASLENVTKYFNTSGLT